MKKLALLLTVATLAITSCENKPAEAEAAAVVDSAATTVVETATTVVDSATTTATEVVDSVKAH